MQPIQWWSPFCRNWVVVVTLLCGSGCGSPWQQFYTPHPLLKGVKLTSTTAVQVRTVEPDRLNAWAVELQRRRAESNVAIEDLGTADRVEETNRLFEVLRIPERAPSADALGMSQFQLDRALSTDDRQLAAFAKQIGADDVVVCCQAGGSVSRMAYQPITTFSAGTASGYVGGGGHTVTGYATGYGTSTTLVPTQVQQGMVLHTAFYVRRLRRNEPQIR